MKAKIILLLLLICSTLSSVAQYKDSVHINLKSNNSIYEVVDMRVASELHLLDSLFHFTPELKKQVEVNIYTLNQLYFEDIRHKNYTIERLLLEQQIKLKTKRTDFLSFFLTKDQMLQFIALEQKAAEKARRIYKIKPTENKTVITLREQAAGWDLLNQTITLSD
jgi:hypothetical protein